MRQRFRETTANDPSYPNAHRREGSLATVQMKPIINPTPKRTEGRALEWGSEFTSKAATLQGGPEETAATLNVKLWVLVVRGGDWWW